MAHHSGVGVVLPLSLTRLRDAIDSHSYSPCDRQKKSENGHIEVSMLKVCSVSYLREAMADTVSC